ncbi:MAG: DNA mismatch repair protein [Bdellovibrio sp. ArHS]|uniref:endonuclease MutS2 n=1 Tax=Bdellovibrio sp. ArHS TaxID=1569284 RepID=UPI000583D1E0|nr:Smr/MutS family protein [Bdellovibrio sp. ArHS]KHD89312.1 MAG: DNA mismatch repair protein [Bdellovibrio sp. ArHS]
MQDLVVLDWIEILEKIRSHATSEAGREAVMETKPLTSKEQAYASFQEIADATEVLNQGVRPFMQSLDLYSTWITRLKKQAVLKTLEIKDVRSFCLEALALKEALSPIENAWARKLAQSLMKADEPLSAIDQILTPGGEIRADASETLYRLYKEKERLAREVQTTLDRLVKAHQMENVLQDKYVTTRDGRWVLPVRSGMQHHLPGVIHGSSQTKQTVFMEPESVIPTNNRLRQIEVEIEDEIERLLTELSRYLSAKAGEIEVTRELLEEADVRFSQAQFSTLIEAHPIEFSIDSLELIEARHPLLQLSGKKVISNSVLLEGKKGILLLSGPNAGGKTVLLKSIGLAAQMARCGLPICASETSKLPFFKDILIGIGDAQSVDEELSTFAAHLKILSKAAAMKGRENLILIDEICGSTDPEEGSALARSFIESFSTNDVFAVITSHLGPLKSGWDEESRVLNGSLEYDPKTGRPTYQFIAGIPGDSLAIQTAKRVGVSQAIVQRALDVLAPATRARLEGLEQIEQLKSDIGLLQDHLKKETNKALEMKRKYEGLLEQFNKDKEEWLQRTLKKAERKVEEAIAQAKVTETFKRHTALQEIKYKLPEIVKAKPVTQPGAPENAEEFAKKFPPGSKVYVPTLSSDGLVQSTPNNKGEVLILSGSVRLQIHWQDLKPPGKPQNPTSQLVRQSSSFTVALADEDRTLDLRGKTVEDALSELEVALDKAATSREDRLKVIHGHGTEALKKAVRTYLSRSIYVKKWKAGSPESGGDGITWVEIGEA